MMKKINNSASHLSHVIDASVDAACKSLNTLSELYETDKFYWHFINSCCKYIQPSADDLDKLSTYSFIIDKLGKIFQKYCATRKVNKSEVPKEINLISNTDVKGYFTWICKIQGIMVKWQEKILEEDFTFNDILAYYGNLLVIGNIAKAVNAGDLVFSDIEIDNLHNRYSTVLAELRSLLIKGNEKYGW